MSRIKAIARRVIARQSNAARVGNAFDSGDGDTAGMLAGSSGPNRSGVARAGASRVTGIGSRLRSGPNSGGSSGSGAAAASEQDMVRRLIEEGERIISEALFSRDTKNYLHNQHDAYGYAVYYDGKMIPGAIGFVGEEESKKPWRGGQPEGRGRDLVMDFLENYDAPAGPRYTLVVANAMPYSMWQEKGLVPGVNRRLRILSQMTGELNSLARELNGKLAFSF